MSFDEDSLYNHAWHGAVARRFANRFACSIGNPKAMLIAGVLAPLGPVLLAPDKESYRRTIKILLLIIVLVLVARLPFELLTM